MTDLRALLGDKCDDVIEKAARVAAESSDTCFEDLDAWNARPEWQRSEEAAWYESIEGAEESAEFWRNQLAAALAAVLPDLLAEANTRAEDAEAKARRFANLLGNNAKALNDVLPREVLRQKADAWDEGRDATLDKVIRFYGLQPHEALFLTNKTPNPYRTRED